MPVSQTPPSMLDRLDRTHSRLREEHSALNFAAERSRISACLSALYDISTCSGGCRGGDHMFEYLCGRAFNLSYAAYDLLQIGLYDEAFNQLRSLGELVNLVTLCMSDNAAFKNWVQADHKERLKRFGPAQVRKLIIASDGPLIVNSDLYSQLCELATHVTPTTAPNRHNETGNTHVGGSVQADGYASGLRLLEDLLFFAATGFAAFVGDTHTVDSLVKLSPT